MTAKKDDLYSKGLDQRLHTRCEAIIIGNKSWPCDNLVPFSLQRRKCKRNWQGKRERESGIEENESKTPAPLDASSSPRICLPGSHQSWVVPKGRKATILFLICFSSAPPTDEGTGYGGEPENSGETVKNDKGRLQNIFLPSLTPTSRQRCPHSCAYGPKVSEQSSLRPWGINSPP